MEWSALKKFIALGYEMKDCPFCGGKATLSWELDEDLWSHDTVKWYKVGCDSCEIYTTPWPESVLQEQVVDVWNNRYDKEQGGKP